MKTILRRFITGRLIAFVMLTLSTLAVLTACNKQSDNVIPGASQKSQQQVNKELLQLSKEKVSIKDPAYFTTHGRMMQTTSPYERGMHWAVDVDDKILLPSNPVSNFERLNLNVGVVYYLNSKDPLYYFSGRKVYSATIVEMYKL